MRLNFRHKKSLIWTLLLLLVFQSVALAAMPCLHAVSTAAGEQSGHCHMASAQQSAAGENDGKLLDCQKCALAVLLLADDNQHLVVRMMPAPADSYQPNVFPHYYSHSQNDLTRPPQIILF
ncbi:MAG: hypothetical protein PVG66_04070 [Chromatiales bacterium]|jgi:hypothetical protein